MQNYIFFSICAIFISLFCNIILIMMHPERNFPTPKCLFLPGQVPRQRALYMSANPVE